MVKRMLVALAVAAAAGFALPAQAACVSTVDTHHATLANGVVIHATETTPAAGCEGTPVRTVEIREGSNVCTGSPADVVTDPFGFGGGPRSAATDECGANYALNVAVAPVLVPAVDSIDANPDGPSAYVALRKEVLVTVASGAYTTPWGNGSIPDGTPAYVDRGVSVTG